MALMHQGMGKLEYETALEFSLRGTNYSARALKHIQQSLRQLNASIGIFEEVYSPSEMDSSTAMEYVYSLQLHAGVACDEVTNFHPMETEKKFEGAIQLWKKAVSSARKSLHGLKVGVQYENLPVVLYNAAICFNSSGQWTTARQLLNESIGMMDGLRYQEVNGQEAVLPKYKGIYENAKFLLQVVESKELNATEVAADDVGLFENEAKKDRVLNVVLPSGEKKQYTLAANDIAVDDLDQGEWIECEDTDLNCEAFEVYEDDDGEVDSSLISKSVPVSLTGVNITSEAAKVSAEVDVSVENDSSLYDGLDEEEKEELRYIRERYARQAARTASQSKSELDLISSLNVSSQPLSDFNGQIDLSNTQQESKPVIEMSDVEYLKNKLTQALQVIDSLQQENSKILERLVILF